MRETKVETTMNELLIHLGSFTPKPTNVSVIRSGFYREPANSMYISWAIATSGRIEIATQNLTSTARLERRRLLSVANLLGAGAELRWTVDAVHTCGL